MSPKNEEKFVDALKTVLLEAAGTVVVLGAMYAIYVVVTSSGSESKKKVKELASRLGRKEIEHMNFSSYEGKFFKDIITCDEIEVTFDNIGGMPEKLQEIKDNVILPLELAIALKSKSNLTPCPTGVLLYGKPGTGKTLTAKAIAKEAGATFINIKSSSLLDKYLGETEKAVQALFSLARKLAPSVIFIDEIDTLLSRGNQSHQVHQNMQGLLLTEWDGLSGGQNCTTGPVIVLGATNRPDDIDKSFLRRMPFSLEIPLPDESGRLDILKKMLQTEQLEEGIDLAILAELTNNFSGSDLRELVRVASLQRVKSMVETAKANINSSNSNSKKSSLAEASSLLSLRPFSFEDFIYSFNKMKGSDISVKDFANRATEERSQEFINQLKLLTKV